MTALASVLTAKAPAAIATIQVAGSSAGRIVGEIFRTSSGGKANFQKGAILTGDIFDGDEIIDHVAAAMTEDDCIEIGCHGNPLIVEAVMGLLKKAGAELISVERLIAEKLIAKGEKNSVEIEAEIEKLKAVSLAGVKLVSGSNLSAVAGRWLERIDSLAIVSITEKCKEILAASEQAKLLIQGCKAVIAGPPNSGKSTLLNCLCGKEKAIVTDIAGTTRDWVSGTCRMGEVVVELFDTAGLDESIIGESSIDGDSQKRSIELLEGCDVVLLVLDSTTDTGDFNFELISQSGKKIIVLFNKCDIGNAINESDVDLEFAAKAVISAKTGDGVEGLAGLMQEVIIDTGLITKTICFTERQFELVGRLSEAVDRDNAAKIITELLNGKVYV